MEKMYFVILIFIFLTIIATGHGKDACNPTGSPCSTNADCCSVSNGRPYCDPEINRCATSRYCDKTSPDECPFNDLTSNEIRNVIKIIEKSKRFGAVLLYPTIRKQEPKKKLWNSGDKAANERIAYAAVYDMKNNLLSEVLISLRSNRIISVTPRPDNVASMTNYEYDTSIEIAQQDARVIRAYERRGLNFTYAAFDIWAERPSFLNGPGTRVVKVIFNYQDPDTKYMDWRPLEYVTMTINIDTKEVISFTDKGNIPVPAPPLSFDSTRDHNMPSEPASTSSVPSSSIEVNGFHVGWHNWQFQYSMDPVFGLQLYHIRYFAEGEDRFLIYKISVSEMFVPYGASGEGWRYRSAFDVGEYRLGSSASPLMLGTDVPENAILLSCPQYDDTTGEVTEMEGCIGIYERPVLPSYYHFDKGSGTHEAKTGSELVITFMCTIGNYDYMFEYIFTMDGNIMVCLMATGILLTKAVLNKMNDPNCIEDCLDYINYHQIGPVHQHFVNYRIDFDIDGPNNIFTQTDFVNDPISSENPDGGAFSLRRTAIRTERYLEANVRNARHWSVINAHARNVFNTPRGASIHPLNVAHTFLRYGDKLSQAGFIEYPMWVTLYNDNEQAAAGDFPRSGLSDQGLPTYIENREIVRDRDIVVWHSLGLSHATRPEEYPFMNKMGCGFNIFSRNFQSGNPLVTLNDSDHDHGSMK